MGFRTVVITQRAKLEFKLGFLVVRGDETFNIFLNEINTLILQSTAISLTAALLNECTKQQIKVIFCDEKCSPHAEMVPYYGNYQNSKRIMQQFKWEHGIKAQLWANIITAKILNQGNLLLKQGHSSEAQMLYGYAQEIELNDTTNREGHAAKVYFNALFGKGFTRGQDSIINTRLNYGYAILLSAFNREIVAAGYLTQIGIWHKNEFNTFNLSSDFMEPFRIMVDHQVVLMKETSNYKEELIGMLSKKVFIDGQETTLDNAIKVYTRSAIDALNSKELSKIKFINDYEL